MIAKFTFNYNGGFEKKENAVFQQGSIGVDSYQVFAPFLTTTQVYIKTKRNGDLEFSLWKQLDYNSTIGGWLKTATQDELLVDGEMKVVFKFNNLVSQETSLWVRKGTLIVPEMTTYEALRDYVENQEIRIDQIINGATDIAFDKTGTNLNSDFVEQAIKEVNTKSDANAQNIADMKDGTTIVKKAEQDKNGNDIVDTYETKSDATSKLALKADKTYVDTQDQALDDYFESEITKIKDGTTIVKKAEQDGSGNVITTTYETKQDVTDKLALKEDKSAKGQPNGYAPVGSDGYIPSAFIPNSFDDVLEFDTYASLLAYATPATSKLYIVKSDETSGGNHSTYRYTGTIYVRVSDEMSASEIKALYESNANTNAFTDLLKAKLDGLLTGNDYYDKTYIDALKDHNGWESELLGTLSNNGTIALSIINQYDEIQMYAKDTLDVIDNENIRPSLMQSGDSVYFFDDTQAFIMVDTVFGFYAPAGYTLQVVGIKYTDLTAEDTSYDNTTSGMTATNVQDAIDEVVTEQTQLNNIQQEVVQARGNKPVLNDRLNLIENGKGIDFSILKDGYERHLYIPFVQGTRYWNGSIVFFESTSFNRITTSQYTMTEDITISCASGYQFAIIPLVNGEHGIDVTWRSDDYTLEYEVGKTFYLNLKRTNDTAITPSESHNISFKCGKFEVPYANLVKMNDGYLNFSEVLNEYDVDFAYTVEPMMNRFIDPESKISTKISQANRGVIDYFVPNKNTYITANSGYKYSIIKTTDKVNGVIVTAFTTDPTKIVFESGYYYFMQFAKVDGTNLTAGDTNPVNIKYKVEFPKLEEIESKVERFDYEYRKIMGFSEELVYNDNLGLPFIAVQSCCTDGTYLYYGMQINNTADSYLHKYNIATKTVVLTANNHSYGHINGMTYNPKTGKLYIAHLDGTGTISIVNPVTLEHESSFSILSTIGYDCAAITYNETLNKYAVLVFNAYPGNANNLKTIAILNADFILEKEFKLLIGSRVAQSLECDSKYIYYVQAYDNTIDVYDWNGRFINTIVLSANGEIESIAKISDTEFYCVKNVGYTNGAYIYKMTVSSENTVPFLEVLMEYQMN